jgi:hypothetical protein
MVRGEGDKDKGTRDKGHVAPLPLLSRSSPRSFVPWCSFIHPCARLVFVRPLRTRSSPPHSFVPRTHLYPALVRTPRSPRTCSRSSAVVVAVAAPAAAAGAGAVRARSHPLLMLLPLLLLPLPLTLLLLLSWVQPPLLLLQPPPLPLGLGFMPNSTRQRPGES